MWWTDWRSEKSQSTSYILEPMPANPEVEASFADLDHPLKPVMQHVRRTLVDADARIEEIVQYGTVCFFS
jgi:hypothetical protein